MEWKLQVKIVHKERGRKKNSSKPIQFENGNFAIREFQREVWGVEFFTLCGALHHICYITGWTLFEEWSKNVKPFTKMKQQLLRRKHDRKWTLAHTRIEIIRIYQVDVGRLGRGKSPVVGQIRRVSPRIQMRESCHYCPLITYSHDENLIVS